MRRTPSGSWATRALCHGPGLRPASHGNSVLEGCADRAHNELVAHWPAAVAELTVEVVACAGRDATVFRAQVKIAPTSTAATSVICAPPSTSMNVRNLGHQ